MKKIFLFVLTLILLVQPFGQTAAVFGAGNVQSSAEKELSTDAAITGSTDSDLKADQDPEADEAAAAAKKRRAKILKFKRWKLLKRTGWVKYDGEKYYLKKGRRVTGLKKINGYYYYFSRRGILRKKNITVDGMKYLVNKKNGKIRGFVMKKKVTPVCQQPELPSGCEIVAWTMMVRHAGIKMNKLKAAAMMPRASNPNAGFVGSPYSAHGYILVVYPGGLMQMTRKYLGTAADMTGAPVEKIQKKLRKGHIVLAWVAGLDGFGSHTIALTGYDDQKVYFNDPWTGTARTMTWGMFNAMWSGNRKRALSY